MSSHTLISTAELPLPSPVLTQRKNQKYHIFYNLDVLLIYSKLQSNTKYQKFCKSPNLAQLPTPGEKATINNRTNIKAIVPKWIKPQINQPTFIHSITPNTHNF